jgi:hypothetical protein
MHIQNSITRSKLLFFCPVLTDSFQYVSYTQLQVNLFIIHLVYVIFEWTEKARLIT